MPRNPLLKTPAECSEAELEAFLTALLASGETPSPNLAERIRKSDCLAWIAGESEAPVALGALKAPKPEHCAGVFKRAGASAQPDTFSLELGWLVGTENDVALVIDALNRRAAGRPVFAIARTDAPALHSALQQNGFHPEGTPYQSPRGDYANQLFLRPA
jgi:hypothetical protein